MRFVVIPVTIIAIWAGTAAQAQNVPKLCDVACLEQRVSALEQARDDRLTTGAVAIAVLPVAPAATETYTYWDTYIPNPATLTPYTSAIICLHSEQSVTVPSEAGGTSQINVRRC